MISPLFDEDVENALRFSGWLGDVHPMSPPGPPAKPEDFCPRCGTWRREYPEASLCPTDLLEDR